MPYTITWMVRERVLFAQISGEITAENGAALFDETGQFLKDFPVNSVYLIQDVQGIEKIPINWGTVVLAFRNRRSPQIKATITISNQSNLLLEIAMTFFARISRTTQYTVVSLPAALDLLRELDPTLASELPEN